MGKRDQMRGTERGEGQRLETIKITNALLKKVGNC